MRARQKPLHMAAFNFTVAKGGGGRASTYRVAGSVGLGAGSRTRDATRAGGRGATPYSCSSILHAMLIVTASDWGLWILTSMLTGGWRPVVKSSTFCASMRVLALGSRALNQS